MSPEVWTDVKSIISTAVTDIANGNSPATIAIEWPNVDFATPAPPLAWIAIDIGGDVTQTIELGNLTWEERGQVWVHVMLPLGTGIEDGLSWRKQLSVAFRAAVPSVDGLRYRDQTFDPLGADDGVWRRLSLIIRYAYDDRLV